MTMHADRLVESPVFILSPMRSGSTLLRVLLDSHSMVRAPHEMHLRTIEVRLGRPYTARAIGHLGLEQEELEHLLWDRLLHRELQRSDKKIIVDKTPSNALVWRRLRRCWPNARFILLVRHPASILTSFRELSPGADPDNTLRMVLDHINGVDEAQREVEGHLVRYEELVADSTRIIQEICSFLRVPWEPEMLAYGKREHGPFEMFLGDFGENIRSGRIVPARPVPAAESIPADLLDACRAWGYAT